MMSTLSLEFLKATLTGDQKARVDSYLNSALYYLITGRKGAWLYKSSHSALIVCHHPHIEDRLIVFPEIGKADYELTASILKDLDVPKNGVQLARYSEDEIIALKHQLSKVDYTPVAGISVIEENMMDWRYPIHILDTEKVSTLGKGKLSPKAKESFKQIRKKFRSAKETITHAPLHKDNGLRFMKAALKVWEGNMIFEEKDTEDMAAFYEEFFKIIEKYPETLNGLLFTQGRKPVGFCIWDQISPDTANSLINLGDRSIKGLSDYQVVSTCTELLKEGIKYLNVGGSETPSLDAFKTKYQPHRTLPVLSADVIYTKAGNPDIQVLRVI